VEARNGRISFFSFGRAKQMIAKRQIMALAILGTSATAMAATLPASQDVFTYSFTPTFNYNTSPILGSSVTTGGAHDTKSLLQFDLSGLSALGVDDHAILNLYVASGSDFGLPAADPSASSPVTTNVSLVTSSWDESTATASLFPTVESIPFTSFVIDGVHKWVSVDITDQVNAWISAPATNFGLALTQDAVVTGAGNTEVAAFYYASESPANQPNLTVVPEPSTLMLAGVTLAFGAMRRRRTV
jgi:hypothetical protein